MRDAVVIGAGLAGLAATIRLARGGASVTLVSKGLGGLQLGQGTIDLLGYSPERVDAPLEAIPAHVASRPTHPYSHFTPEAIGEAAAWLRDLLGEDLLVGDPARNVVLPTAVGALRPTSLVQPSMLAGVPRGQDYVIVGLERLKDFAPALIAENLARQNGPNGTPISARWFKVDLEVRGDEVDTNGVNHARALDHPEMRERLADLIRPHLRAGEVVGLPAVLGLDDLGVWRHLSELLGHEVFEIPLQPPSVPGMRLNQALLGIAKREARVIQGVRVIDRAITDGRISSVTIASAGHQRVIETRNVVLAAGGFESGALELDSWGQVRDTVLGLPLVGTEGQLLHADFWGEDQPLFLSGIGVDDGMRPLAQDGTVAVDGVRAAGGCLAGATRWREKSGEGIALASALRAADSILGSL